MIAAARSMFIEHLLQPPATDILVTGSGSGKQDIMS